MADACLSLASLLTGQDNFAESARLLQRAVEIRRAALGDDHDDVLAAVVALGHCLQAQGEHAAAEMHFQWVLAARRSRGGEDDLDLARAIENLASVSTAQKQFDRAVALLQEAMQIRQRLYGPDHKQVAHGLHSLAETYRSMGSLDEAEDHYRQALAIFRSAPDQTANVVLMHIQLGRLEQDRGDIESALPLYDQALEQARAAFPAWHYITLWCHKEYGKCLARAGRFEPAEEMLKAALQGLSKLSDDDDSLPREMRIALADLYRDWGKAELEARFRDPAREE